MIIALGTGLAPHLSKAVWEGWNHMAGEFVRTPKHGLNKGRYRARADLPMLETGLALLSFVSVVASVRTGHYFATPFAGLFTIGYGYVALLVAQEQVVRRRDAQEPVSTPALPASDSIPASAPSATFSRQGESVSNLAA